MPEKCPRNARKMPEKCPRNARKMPEKCPRTREKPARTHKTAENHNFWGHGRKFRSKNLGCIFRTKNHDSAKNATEALHSIGLTHISTCFKNTKKVAPALDFEKCRSADVSHLKSLQRGDPYQGFQLNVYVSHLHKPLLHRRFERSNSSARTSSGFVEKCGV